MPAARPPHRRPHCHHRPLRSSRAGGDEDERKKLSEAEVLDMLKQVLAEEGVAMSAADPMLSTAAAYASHIAMRLCNRKLTAPEEWDEKVRRGAGVVLGGRREEWRRRLGWLTPPAC